MIDGVAKGEHGQGRIPLGRPQSTVDIGHACAYLASDRAANITGEALNVSGGTRVFTTHAIGPIFVFSALTLSGICACGTNIFGPGS